MENVKNCSGGVPAEERWGEIFKQPEAYEYYALNSPHEAMHEVANYFNQAGVKSVLDVGCGLGANMAILARLGFSVSGIDAASQGLEVADANLRSIPSVDYDLQLAQFQKLPYDDESFDSAISVQVLYHGTESAVLAGIAETSRVLKPGGHVFITLPGRLANGKVRHCLVKTADQVGKQSFVPTIGSEKGVEHQIYNLKRIRHDYKDFHIDRQWKDSRGYYAMIAHKRG